MGVGQADKGLIGRAVFGMSAIVALAREAANPNGVVVFAALLPVDQVLEGNHVSWPSGGSCHFRRCHRRRLAATIATAGASAPSGTRRSLERRRTGAREDDRMGPIRHRGDAVHRSRRVVGQRRSGASCTTSCGLQGPDDGVGAAVGREHDAVRRLQAT